MLNHSLTRKFNRQNTGEKHRQRNISKPILLWENDRHVTMTTNYHVMTVAMIRDCEIYTVVSDWHKILLWLAPLGYWENWPAPACEPAGGPLVTCRLSACCPDSKLYREILTQTWWNCCCCFLKMKKTVVIFIKNRETEIQKDWHEAEDVYFHSES